MRRLLLILLVFCSMVAYAQVDTKPTNPEFYPLQTPNNANWYWNPVDSSLWEYHSGKWQRVASHAKMMDLLDGKEDTIPVGLSTQYWNGEKQWVDFPSVGEDGYWTVVGESEEVVKYGYLYNRGAAMGDTDGDGVSETSIASTGWRLPSYGDYESLITYLDPDGVPFNGSTTANDAGKYLKEVGTQYWTSPNSNASNSVGFNGRGGGYRSYTSTANFSSLLNEGRYGAIYNTNTWYSFRLTYNNDALLSLGMDKAIGVSLRLMRDATVEEQSLPDGTPLSDYIGNDGRSYNTVKIGNQVWLSENLMETKYLDGTDIPEVTMAGSWSGRSTGARCVYNNDESNAFETASNTNQVFHTDSLFLHPSIQGVGTEIDPLRVSADTIFTTIALSDETTDLETGTAVRTFRMPVSCTVTGVRASVTTAPSGANLQFDINENGVSILSTALSIDDGEKTSTTATTQAVVSDDQISDDSEISIDIDLVGLTVAGAGAKIIIYYTKN